MFKLEFGRQVNGKVSDNQLLQTEFHLVPLCKTGPGCSKLRHC